MVPEGWEYKTLGKIAKWSSGGTPSKARLEFWGGGIPWISAVSMRGHYYSESELTISDLAVKSGTKMASKGDILLLVRGSMLWNKIPVGLATRDVSFNQDVKCLSPISKIVSSEFLIYWFLANENKLMHMVTGTGIGAGKLDTNELQTLSVLIPTIQEQQKIAKILSTWDKAINTTQALIDVNKQQKKALMQQLLTGKTRFPGYSENWKEYSLQQLGTTYNGLSGKSKNDFKNGKPYISYMNIFKNSKIDITAVDLVIILEGERQNRVRYGDIFFTTSSETANEVGMSSVLLDDLNETYLNSFCFGFRLHNFNYLLPVFAQFFLRSTRIRKAISALAQGATRYNLSSSRLMRIKFMLPAIEEQKKMSDILFSADKQIEMLQQKLDCLKQEKKSLMQQLLTGKRRVKTNTINKSNKKVFHD